MKTMREYLDEYAREHTQLGTRLTHMIGIPMILASLPLLPLAPPVGGALFAAGWAWQFAGHWLFEHNRPAFFGDPMHLVAGAIWAIVEWAELFGIRIPGFERAEPAGERAAASAMPRQAVN